MRGKGVRQRQPERTWPWKNDWGAQQDRTREDADHRYMRPMGNRRKQSGR